MKRTHRFCLACLFIFCVASTATAEINIPESSDPYSIAALHHLPSLAEAERKEAEAEKELKAKTEEEYYISIKNQMFAGKPARHLTPHSEDEQLWLRDLHLLTNTRPCCLISTFSFADVSLNLGYQNFKIFVLLH